MVVVSDDIFYKPHLQIPESYHTDGKPPHAATTPSSTTLSEQPTNTLSYLKETCKTVLKTLVTLPVPIRKPLETGLFTVQFMLTLIPEDEYETIKTPSSPEEIHITEYQPHENETSDNKQFENVLSDIFGAQKVEYATKTNAERINYKYYASLYNIIEDYIDKVKRALAQYHTTLFSQVGFENLEIAQKHYIADHDSLVQALGTNEGNVSDLLVRQNATKHQKLRLLNKLCNERISLTHIKSCELSRLLLLRYYGIEKNNNYFHDAALMQQIKTEEAKLDKKIEQFYKYLNTSVILVNECLMLHAHEAIAKQYLQNKVDENLEDESISLFASIETDNVEDNENDTSNETEETEGNETTENKEEQTEDGLSKS